MKRIYFTSILFVFCFTLTKAQSLYFPPLTGSTWDTISPQSLNWCQARIDSLYNYLQVKNTRSFIILKNGKIVLEKYFGSYTVDSLHYWASASKSLTSFLTGIAQKNGLININNKVSQYIGTGWTSAPLVKENLITVKNLLQMTSGLDDGPPFPCTNEDTAKSCLLYQVNAGTRWAYHTGAYKKVQDVISTSAGLNYNTVTNNWIESKTGMSGFWFQQVYYSTARDMARFGLLNLNKGIWNTDTIMKDSLYFKAMINTSQNFNQSYGYLWWLNGKATYMNPGIQLVLNGPLIPNCPNDMFAALGKNDQKIYVIPSTGMVVIRQGNSAENVTFALSTFDNTLWDYINKLNCVNAGINVNDLSQKITIYPNPVKDMITIKSDVELRSISIKNGIGQSFEIKLRNNTIDVSQLQKGLYFLTITSSTNINLVRKIVID
ncbi:MAG: serine hydrolase [Bacteroidetes bacterium]|nr:serine hydrolase [Bacteroidota bacterium]